MSMDGGIKVSEKMDSGVTRWSKRGGLMIVGWVLANITHGTQTLETKAARADVVQQHAVIVQKEATCEHKRGDKAIALAGQAILSAQIDAVPTPKFKDLPVDNCPHAAPK